MKIILRFIVFVCLCGFFASSAFSQIGYQVSLLNTSTGEPRANVSVKAGITITDADGGIVFSGDRFATTNDFGVLSLTVGDSDTFNNADWNKLPFYISVTVDDVLIGRSQILNVPVAEYAKQSGPVLTKEMLVGKRWVADYRYVAEYGDAGNYGTITFYDNYLIYENNCIDGYGSDWSIKSEYFIQGDKVYFYRIYSSDNNKEYLYGIEYVFGYNFFIDDGVIFKLN